MTLRDALPLGIFALAYLVLARGNLPPLRLDRAGAALVGAVAMVVSGAVSPEEAQAAISFPTLMLLLGMMIVVANLRLSGAFTVAARLVLAGGLRADNVAALRIAERLGYTEFGRGHEVRYRDGAYVDEVWLVMQREADAKHVFLHGFQNTKAGFGHWNEAGHALAAELIAQDLCRKP